MNSFWSYVILTALVVMVGIIAFPLYFGQAHAASFLGSKQWTLSGSTVHRVVDDEAGVICYVIPKDHCVGDCAYSPAISCVHK